MAIVDTKTDKFRIYRYAVNELYLLLPGENLKLDAERLNSLTVLEDFLGNMYPILKIDLALEQSTYNKIISNKAKLKVRIDLRKYYMEGTSTVHSPMQAHLSGAFSLILDDAVNTVDETAHNAEYPEGDFNEMNAVTTGMELFLFSGDLIKANTGIINAILKDCSVIDALGYALEQVGINKNIIMPPIDNSEIYPELVIPPLRISKAVSFLDSYYGIYRSGTVFYFGLTRNYILPYCKRCGALGPGEKECVNIVVPKTGSDITDKQCTMFKASGGGEPYIIADGDSFLPANKDVTAKVLHAENVDIVDNELGAISKVRDKNKKVVIKPGENSFYRESYVSRVQAESVVITITVKDCDLEPFTPNKIYKFLFEDTSMTKQYNGVYHLVKMDQTFLKEESDLTGGATLTFHKSV